VNLQQSWALKSEDLRIVSRGMGVVWDGSTAAPGGLASRVAPPPYNIHCNYRSASVAESRRDFFGHCMGAEDTRSPILLNEQGLSILPHTTVRIPIRLLWIVPFVIRQVLKVC
jgi:hypothetical protein